MHLLLTTAVDVTDADVTTGFDAETFESFDCCILEFVDCCLKAAAVGPSNSSLNS